MNDNLNEENIENEELTNVVTLQDEEGKDVKFEFLDLIEFENENYVVLLPMDEEESDEVVILREEGITEAGDEETYGSVEDQRILDSVFAIFREKFQDEFDFED